MSESAKSAKSAKQIFANFVKFVRQTLSATRRSVGSMIEAEYPTNYQRISNLSLTIRPFRVAILAVLLLFVAGWNSEVWGWVGVKVNAYSNPSDGGYVYVNTSNSGPGSYSLTSDNASQKNDWAVTSKSWDFYLFASAKSGYTFKGWATSDNTNSVESTTRTGYKVNKKGNVGVSYTEYNYYAIFARLASTTVSGSTFQFGDIVVGEESGTQTLTINHAHAGTVSLSKSGHSDDFVLSENSFTSVAEDTKNITIKFKPTSNGLRTCTLTVSSNNGLSPLTYILTGTGYNQPSINWVDGNGVKLASGETTLSAGDVLRASCTTGQTVSYSGYNASYFTAGTDGEGNPILTVREDISGTINNLSVTANLAKNSSTYYAAYTETFTLNVTNLTPQTIEWTNDISDISDEEIGHTITLDAVAKNAKTGANSGQAITYSMAANDYLSLSGNVLTVKAIGGPVAITATAAGSENYAPTSVTKYATVIDMSHPCATSDSHDGKTLDKDNKSLVIYPTLPGKLTFNLKRSSSWFVLNKFTIKEYNSNNGVVATTEYNNSDISTSGETKTINCNANTTKIEFYCDAYLSYSCTVSNVSTTRVTTSSVSVNSLSYETDPGQSLSKQVTVTYSNIPVFLSFKSDEDADAKGTSLWSLSTGKFGGCGKKGSQNVTVAFRSNAKGNYTDKLYVRNNVGTLLHTIDLSASVTAQEQFLDTWNIADVYNSTDQVTLAAATTIGNTDFTFTATTSNPANIVSISNAGVMNFSGSGTATIRAYQPGDAMSQEFVATHTITISKVTPELTAPTSGTEIQYLQTLSNSTIANDGVAKVTLRGVENTVVAGTWAWSNPTQVIKDNAGTHTYEVTFTPTDGGMYTTNTCMVPVTILRAAQAIAMNNGTVKVAVDGIDANKADSKIDLDNLIASQTSDIVNSVQRAGAVTYEVISANKANATIGEGNVFSATVIGDYTIRATKAETGFYNAATADFTVSVTKRANTMVTAGPYTKYVDEEVLNVATVVNSDGEIHTSSTDATIAYYDVANNKIVIPNSEAKSFDQTEVTIKIWQDGTTRFEGIAEADAKTITLTVKKYDNPFACSWGAWTYTANFEDVVPVEFTTANTDYAHFPIVITQTSGENVATLVNNDATHNTITASYVRDNATWHLSQAESYKYKAGAQDVTMLVRTLPATCYIFESEQDKEYSFYNEANALSGHYDSPFEIHGPVKAISFEERKDAIGVNKSITGDIYSVVQYSVDGGGTWRTLMRPDLGSSYQTYTREFSNADDPLGENETVTHIRFGADRGGTMYKYYKNIKVTRATNIKPLDKENNLIAAITMPQNTVGGSTTEKFYMKFSSCDEVVKLTSNNPHFTLSNTEITVDPDDANNHAEITITYSSNEVGTHNGVITLYTKYQNRTFTVSGTTAKKVQTIEWKEGFTGDPLTLQKGLVVDNTNIAATASSDRPVIYSTDNEDVIEIILNGLGFRIKGEGSANLTASEAGDAVWAPVSETKTIIATGKPVQTILWDQNLVSELEMGQEVVLDAKVYIRDAATGDLTYNAERTALINYSCPVNSVISLEGNTMTVIGYGLTTITATVAGNATYVEAQPVVVSVRVREPSAGCETPLVLDHPENVRLYSDDYSASGSLSEWTTPQIFSQIVLDLTKGKPDKLSYKHNGELASIPVFGAIKRCEGTVKVQERVNGNWTDVEGSSYNNGGQNGAYNWRDVMDLQLNENADAIRFVREHHGSGAHNFKDIQITLLQYVRPVQAIIEAENVLDLGDIEVGEAHAAVVSFDYSDVKGEILATKGNTEDAVLELNEKTIYLDCGSHGQHDLPITLRPTVEGEWSNTVTLTDRLTNVATTITVRANVVPGKKYTFNGGEDGNSTQWGTSANWEENEKPGAHDNVIIQSDVEIIGNVTVGSLTIDEGATVTVTVTGNLTIGDGNSYLQTGYGDLHVVDGGSVTMGNGVVIVRDLILDAALGSTETGGSSGQFSDENQKMVLDRDAYFQMDFDPSGQVTYGWYDFTVPFEVNIKDGIFRQGESEHLVDGTDFLVMEHSESARAAGKTDWKMAHGTMYPGRVYTITLDDEVTQNTILFKKKKGAALGGSNDFSAQCSSGDADKRGWNGLGNGTMHHTQLNGLASGTKVQLYDHTNNVYVPRNAGQLTYAVGTSFFMQVDGAQTITLSQATNGYDFLAPARESRVVEEFRLGLTEDATEKKADVLYISASEEATEAYVIGHDLIKMGTPAEAKVAQMWAVKGDYNLCDVEAEMVNSNSNTPLALYAPKAGNYTLAVEEAPEDAMLYLTYEGTPIWNLSYSPYVFDLAKGKTEGYGLRIYAQESSQITTGVEEVDGGKDACTKVVIDQTMYIITPDGAMYSVTGKKIK